MEVEKFFDFLPDGAIRIKGHRIDLEHVVREYNRGMNKKELLEHFPSLSQEEIQACLDYYRSHKESIDEDMRKWDEEEDRAYQEQQRDPRIIALKKRMQETRERLEATPGSPFYKG